MYWANGEARYVAAQPISRKRPARMAGWHDLLIVGAIEVRADVGGLVLVREHARAPAR